MARKATPASAKEAPPPSARRPFWRRLWFWVKRHLWLWAKRGLLGLAALWGGMILVFALVPPPINAYQIYEAARLGGIEKDWVSLADMSPHLPRAVLAAEDANFCLHWGFDMKAIRLAIDEGRGRGASTLSQQVVKNVFLWPGRSYLRKALEAALTPVVELVWTKRRIVEVYLNVAEFGEGIFGVEAAAQHYFGVSAGEVTLEQAARLAAVLPDPKDRNPAELSAALRRKMRQAMEGAETLRQDGRADCLGLEG